VLGQIQTKIVKWWDDQFHGRNPVREKSA